MGIWKASFVFSCLVLLLHFSINGESLYAFSYPHLYQRPIGPEQTIVNSTSDYQSHAIIDIYGNDELKSIAALENWRGNGTLDFPYVIEQFLIESNDTIPLIKIRDTNPY